MTKQTIIYYPIWMKILIFIDNGVYISQISNSNMYTYSHVHKIITLLANDRIIILNKTGRNKVISLTSKGLKMKNLLIDLIKTAEDC